MPSTVVVIGGGVMGLGIGWRLAQAGVRVTVLDAGPVGRGASWAAAGMLAAGVEAEPGEGCLFALNRASQRRWPAFARELEAATGLELGYRTEGTLAVALNRDDAERLRHEIGFHTAQGIDASWLTARDLRAREPYVAPAVVGAAFYPDDHQVDNRRLSEALQVAFERAGGTVLANCPVERVTSTADRVTGVVAAARPIAAELVILTAGAWSGQIAGLPPLAVPPVRPIKGQLIALAMDRARPILRHTLWAPRVYLVPRSSGRLVIGATVEEAGFRPELTAGGLLSLLEPAWRVLPALEELAVEETWAGFRPGSPDDAPILGQTPLPGLLIATGHHRNGILLSPLTIDAMAQLALTGEVDPAIRPFGLDRFDARKKAS